MIMFSALISAPLPPTPADFSFSSLIHSSFDYFIKVHVSFEWDDVRNKPRWRHNWSDDLAIDSAKRDTLSINKHDFKNKDDFE